MKIGVDLKGLVTAGCKGNHLVRGILNDVRNLVTRVGQAIFYVKCKVIWINCKGTFVLRESKFNLSVGFTDKSELLVTAEAMLLYAIVTAAVDQTVKACVWEKQNCASCPLAALVLPGALDTLMNDASDLGTKRVYLNSGGIIKNLVNHIT